MHDLKLHELQPSTGARHARKRVGRGTSSGYGKTAGKGTKGQLARQGGKTRLGFEGGQMPLFRRMPKRGFSNINRKEYAVINLQDLNRFNDGTEITPALLVESGVVKKELSGIKLLAKGELTVKDLKIQVNKFSPAAKDAVEAAGGTVEVI
ncbi:ribosomal protein L15 [Schleiferilactobacillus harbinensis DSM 16991]|uniref:Large ribosomal subunit protein uL15 n=1 Tax=Schleiferilactobacillus harbinensis DSM 16991 TaxID=1122147 RepID=A0A0R1XD69_9LACO|nr:ribosomal protein L15 [Schleiferilactobacillus harbinensis DSM 16991]